MAFINLYLQRVREEVDKADGSIEVFLKFNVKILSMPWVFTIKYFKIAQEEGMGKQILYSRINIVVFWFLSLIVTDILSAQ